MTTLAPLSHVPAAPLVLTWTKVKELRTCPLMCRRHFIDQAAAAAQEPLETGGGTHAWVEDLTRRMLAGDPPTDEDAYRILLRKAAVLDAKVADDLRRLARRIIVRGWLPPIPDNAESVGVEEPWAVRADGAPCPFDDPQALIRSVFDLRFRVRNAGVVCDYKTNRQIVPDWSQLRIYGWALTCIEPDLTEIDGEFHFLRHGARRAQTFASDMLRAEVPDELLAVRAELARRIREDAWEPRVTTACSWCGYRATCPEFGSPDLAPIQPIASLDEATVAAHGLAVLQGLVEDATDRLKAWVEQHGDIALGDEALGFVVSARESVANPRETMRILRGLAREHGTDMQSLDAALWRSLALPKSGLQNAVRAACDGAPRGTKRQAQEAAMEALRAADMMETKAVTVFRRYRVGEEATEDDDGEA